MHIAPDRLSSFFEYDRLETYQGIIYGEYGSI